MKLVYDVWYTCFQQYDFPLSFRVCHLFHDWIPSFKDRYSSLSSNKKNTMWSFVSKQGNIACVHQMIEKGADDWK